jgi:hypothetical protein
MTSPRPVGPRSELVPTNGVLLSKSVHMRFHRKYKFGANTEEQFIEFCDICYEIDWLEIKKC